MDALAVWEALPDKAENVLHILIIDAESVAVAEENCFRIAVCLDNTADFLLNLSERQFAVFKMLEKTAEKTGVVGAAHRHRQHICASLHR